MLSLDLTWEERAVRVLGVFNAQAIELDVIEHFDNALTFIGTEGLPGQDRTGELHVGITGYYTGLLNAIELLGN